MDIEIDRRARVYESLLPLYISSIWGRYQASTPEVKVHEGVKRRRRRLMEIMPNEIINDPLLFEAIDGVLSIEY